ncbi:MAG: hypothetical protein H0X17_03715 [Deltaproteobacteria bacterium]|nr:hypothetical protein [Deltaproteobacteria bacterium]
MHRSLLPATVLAVGLLACGSKADEKAGAAPGGSPATSGAQAAQMPKGKVGPGRVQLPGLGISVDVPRPVSMRMGQTHQGKPRLSIDLGDSRVDSMQKP